MITINGGEFTKKGFNALLYKLGIQHQNSIAYTPQQNRVAERKNRTLVEMDRCMIYSKGLHKCFWNEDICFSHYILNRFHTKEVL